MKTGGDDGSRRLAAALLHDVWVVEDVTNLDPAFNGIAVTKDGRVWSPKTRELRQVAPGGDDRVLKERNRRDALVKQVDEAAKAERQALAQVDAAQQKVAEADAQRDAVAATPGPPPAPATRPRRPSATRWVIQQRKAAPDEGPSADRKAQVEAAIATERRLAERAKRERDERARRTEARTSPAAARSTAQADGRALRRRADPAPAVFATHVEALEAELNADKAAGEQLATELRNCAGEESRVHARLKERGEAVTRGEVQAQRARDHAEDAETALTTLATKLGLEPEPTETPLDDDERARLHTQLERLQRRREQLGPVNPLAQAEYKEALEHVQELEAQREDMETAMRESRA